MDFDDIENLNEEQILDLYNDVLSIEDDVDVRMARYCYSYSTWTTYECK